ncbi:hypothetical protein HY844_01295 [Candidatus Berkelbacteria bacterium]|nr:hypothetical protein [Candidatus Berkelbacteria bacterium]
MEAIDQLRKNRYNPDIASKFNEHSSAVRLYLVQLKDRLKKAEDVDLSLHSALKATYHACVGGDSVTIYVGRDETDVTVAVKETLPMLRGLISDLCRLKVQISKGGMPTKKSEDRWMERFSRISNSSAFYTPAKQ